MKKMLVVIRDTMAGDDLGPPTLENHDATAVRFFNDVATLPNSRVAKHIESMSLYHIGNYDDETMALEPVTPREIVNGIQWMHVQQSKNAQQGETN